MTKEEKIQESYGKYWDTVKDYVDKNGWFNHGFEFENVPYLEDSFFYFTEFTRESRDSTMRPISLTGIETNNRWVKIESKDDLPKESYSIYHVITKTGIYCKNPKNKNTEEYWQDDTNKENWWLENVMYYQPLVIPNDPIY